MKGSYPNMPSPAADPALSRTHRFLPWASVTSRLLVAFVILHAIPASAFQSSASSFTTTGVYENAGAADQTGSFPIAAIPWNKYTELSQFAAAPGTNGTIQLNYLTQADINEFIARAHAAGVKAVVQIMSLNSSDFSNATSPANIAAFVANVVKLVNNNGYDGVAFDWEAGVIASQYNDLLSRTRAALPTKLIEVEVFNSPELISAVKTSQSKIDRADVMCYDMYDGDGFRRTTWYNDALFQNGLNFMTCDWRVNGFTDAGVAPNKLSVGIPFYGQRWTNATQPLQAGGVIAAAMLHNELVTDATRWKDAYKKWDASHYAAYISDTSRNEFISYTSEQFIEEVVKWARSRGFAGVFTYSLGYEYLPGEAGDAQHPLSKALYDAVNGGTLAPPTNLRIQ